MVNIVGSASTNNEDRLKYRLLPSCNTLKNLSNARTALHAKLHTLMTDSSVPNARSELRHTSKSPVVRYGAGCHDGRMNLNRCVTCSELRRLHTHARFQHGTQKFVRNQHALKVGQVGEGGITSQQRVHETIEHECVEGEHHCNDSSKDALVVRDSLHQVYHLLALGVWSVFQTWRYAGRGIIRGVRHTRGAFEWPE